MKVKSNLSLPPKDMILVYVAMDTDGMTKQEIYDKLEEVEKTLKQVYPNKNIGVIDTSEQTDHHYINEIERLSEDLKNLAIADLVYFTEDYLEVSRIGTVYSQAIRYKVPIIFEKL